MRDKGACGTKGKARILMDPGLATSGGCFGLLDLRSRPLLRESAHQWTTTLSPIRDSLYSRLMPFQSRTLMQPWEAPE